MGHGCSFVQGKMLKHKAGKRKGPFPSVLRCQVENERQASIFRAEPGLCVNKGNSDLSMERASGEYK